MRCKRLGSTDPTPGVGTPALPPLFPVATSSMGHSGQSSQVAASPRRSPRSGGQGCHASMLAPAVESALNLNRPSIPASSTSAATGVTALDRG
jgi:hypothetical protein